MTQQIQPTTSIWQGTMFDQTSNLRPSASSAATPSVVPSGSQAAGEVAARISGKRKQRILELLQQRGPMALWELAEAMSVQVNQISGRLSELNADALIDQVGTRNHPVSHVPCAVWQINAKGQQHMRSTRI